MTYAIDGDTIMVTEKERRSALVMRAAKGFGDGVFATKKEAAKSIIGEYWGSFPESSREGKITGLVRRIRIAVRSLYPAVFMP